MVNRDTRRALLIVFALANLVCWVGAAIVIGLVVGDEVDLGVETLLRRGQATAVVAWEQTWQQASRPKATPEVEVQATQPAPFEPAEDNPPATITWPAPTSPVSYPQQTATQLVAQAMTADPALPDAPSTPEPTATLVSSPLLMADPELNSLTRLNAELSRSAPERAVQIRFQEDALNREIAAMWQRNPELPYRNVKVDLKRAQAIVTGNVTLFGFELITKITGHVVAQDCLPQFEISSVSVEGLAALPFLEDQIGQLLHEAMNWYPADYPLCLEQIVLEETRATVYGYRR